MPVCLVRRRPLPKPSPSRRAQRRRELAVPRRTAARHRRWVEVMCALMEDVAARRRLARDVHAVLAVEVIQAQAAVGSHRGRTTRPRAPHTHRSMTPTLLVPAAEEGKQQTTLRFEHHATSAREAIAGAGEPWEGKGNAAHVLRRARPNAILPGARAAPVVRRPAGGGATALHAGLPANAGGAAVHKPLRGSALSVRLQPRPGCMLYNAVAVRQGLRVLRRGLTG
jgi:hypothetical protein